MYIYIYIYIYICAYIYIYIYRIVSSCFCTLKSAQSQLLARAEVDE